MKLIWDKIGERLYETGVKKGVLFLRDSVGAYPLGVAWNGLTNITESPSGAESSPLHADDIKYGSIKSTEEYGATIEAYTYPDEFAACDGSAELATGVSIGQQKRSIFGLAYQTAIGNDVDDLDHGYKLHLVYGAEAAPSEKAYGTINDSPEAITFSWEVSTTPVAVTGKKPTAHLVIDSTKVDAAKLVTLEGIIFGTDVADARLPLPDEVATLFTGEAPAALALSSIVPDDDTPDVAINANIVLTFNNKIQREAIVVASATGAIVAGVKTWDATGEILTFDPAVDLTNGTTYIVTVGGVVDIYGQSLAAVVKNFATIA
jgi:hypothetical protein